jgi:hypothetical protein
MTTTRTKGTKIRGIGGWIIRGYVAGSLVSETWTAGSIADAKAEELSMRQRWLSRQARKSAVSL